MNLRNSSTSSQRKEECSRPFLFLNGPPSKKKQDLYLFFFSLIIFPLYPRILPRLLNICIRVYEERGRRNGEAVSVLLGEMKVKEIYTLSCKPPAQFSVFQYFLTLVRYIYIQLNYKETFSLFTQYRLLPSTARLHKLQLNAACHIFR